MHQDPPEHLPIRSLFTSRSAPTRTNPLFDPLSSSPRAQQVDESDSASTTSSGADLHVNDDEEFFPLKNDSVSSIAASIMENDTVMESAEMAMPKENTHVLPPELLISIFGRLSAPSDLLNCMKMSKRWARNSVELLWHRPVCNTWDNLTTVANAVVDSRSYFPYEQLIRRLNLCTLSEQINDGTLQPFTNCKRIERLTLTNCLNVGDQGIMNIVKGSSGLLALDITGLHTVSDSSIHALASNCPKLQGLNITGCRRVTDESLVHLARSCRYLKRVSLNLAPASRDLVNLYCSSSSTNAVPSPMNLSLHSLRTVLFSLKSTSRSASSSPTPRSLPSSTAAIICANFALLSAISLPTKPSSGSIPI